MARKKVAAKAKAQPKLTTPKRQRDEEQNAIDQAAAEDGPAAAKKQKQADSVEADTLKALKDNFKGFTDFQLRMVLDTDGKGIYDRVYERKLAKVMDHKVACGKLFYKDLKEEFFTTAGNTGLPSVPADDKEDAELFMCLKAVIRHNRYFVPCTTFLSASPQLNVLNLHAVLQATLKITPGGQRGECTEFILDVMRFVVRVGHDVANSQSVLVCKGHFDQVLCKDLFGHRANQGSGFVWWQTRKAFAKLVLPMASTEKCLQQGVQAIAVMTELREVADSSMVGRMLAEKPLRDAQQDNFMNIVKDTLDELPSDKLTQEILSANQVKFFTRCTEIGAKPTETHKATYYQFQHLGVGFAMPVQSLLETYSFARECIVRTDAVRCGMLDPLFCEVQLGNVPVVAGVGHVDESLIDNASYCRQEAAKFLNGEEPTAQHIADIYKERIHHLLTFDKFAKLEHQLF